MTQHNESILRDQFFNDVNKYEDLFTAYYEDRVTQLDSIDAYFMNQGTVRKLADSYVSLNELRHALTNWDDVWNKIIRDFPNKPGYQNKLYTKVKEYFNQEVFTWRNHWLSNMKKDNDERNFKRTASSMGTSGARTRQLKKLADLVIEGKLDEAKEYSLYLKKKGYIK
jgi:hypothetical protein